MEWSEAKSASLEGMCTEKLTVKPEKIAKGEKWNSSRKK